MTEEEYFEIAAEDEMQQFNERGEYDPFYVGFIPLEEDYQEPEEAEYDVV